MPWECLVAPFLQGLFPGAEQCLAEIEGTSGLSHRDITNKAIALASMINSWTPCRAATTSKARTECDLAFSVAPCR